MTMMSLETNCLPIHIKSDDDSEGASNYERTKRRKVEADQGGIDHHEIKDASASCLCDYCANFADRFGFLHEGIFNTLSDEYIERLRRLNTDKLLRQRKLHLVLNLDHIFLTYTNLSDLTPEEEEFLETLADSQEVHKVQIPPKMKPMIIKFRPSLRNFLKEASGLFEIYAYTNAPRPLVWKIVKLLDPRNEYFGRRVITPDYLCSTHEGKKCLNPVLGQESAVLVVDDNLCGWKRENRKNVQVVSKYSFFKKRSGQKRKRKSLCELKSDEGTECLVVLLRNLKRIHSRFFVDEVMFNRDVRMLLKIDWDPICEDGRLKLWKRTLSNYMQKKVMASLRQQKKIAGQSSRTTYVKEQVDNPSSSEVAGAAHVERSQARWIHPSWIDISIRLWQKGHAGKFPLILKDSEFTCSSCGCNSFWNTGISLGSERKQHMCPSEEASIDPFVEIKESPEEKFSVTD